jgi:hypothetical protein
MDWGWLKVAATGLGLGLTSAATTLAASCGNDTTCYSSHWMAALLGGVVIGLGGGAAHAATSPLASK